MSDKLKWEAPELSIKYPISEIVTTIGNLFPTISAAIATASGVPKEKLFGDLKKQLSRIEQEDEKEYWKEVHKTLFEEIP